MKMQHSSTVCTRSRTSLRHSFHEPRLGPRIKAGIARGVSVDAAAKEVVIVGQGWAGGLATGWRTASGKEVEAGMKGFWYQYKNIFSLLEELQLPEWPLTDWTTSGFWSPRGLVTEAPVFSKLPRLPTLVGQFVHTFPLYWSLSLQDRLTMLPFLAAFIDFNSSPETFEKYDKMSAHELFVKCGVSKAAYEEFLRPTLLVGLFAPPEQISAASMLETLGSIAEKIFSPLIQKIESNGGKIIGNRVVTGLTTGEDKEVQEVKAVDRETGQEVTYKADAVIFAIGIGGMQKLVASCPELAAAEEFRAVMNLKSLDVIATRLWLDKKVKTRYPANVLSGFEPSAGAGATYFHLNDLQDEYKDVPGSVITADFYNASALLPLSDDAIVARVKAHLETCEPQVFKGTKVVDSAVLRFAKAVTHFSPGSHQHRPFQTTSIPNVFLAGDWVRGVPHGANGLSQERAYVTGLIAANLVVSRCGDGSQAKIIDTEEDELHVQAAKQAVKQARELVDALGIKSPFL